MRARDGALSGLRVVDLSHYLAGPLVAMLLGDLGADVVRVDPPGGPRWRHPANAVLQRGKRSLVLDLKEAGDLAIAQRLVAAADVVVESFRPGVAERLGVGPGDALEKNPRLVYCSLPGFPAADPRAGMRAWEGVVTAAGGLFRPPPGRAQDLQFTAHPVVSSFAAIIASHSVMAALIARERTGHGQRIETSLYDAAFEAFGHEGEQVEGDPPPPPRPDPGSLPQVGHYRCRDGIWIQLCLIQPRHLEWFARTFLPERWIAEGMADAKRLREDPELAARARARLEGLLITRTAREWEEAINEQSGAGTAISQTTEAWLRRDPHARASRAVIELDDPEYGRTAQAGHPIDLTETPPRAWGPRRPLDADREEVLAELDARPPAAATATAARGAASGSAALSGFRVLDLSSVLAGPTAARILAEYGADVVKINAPDDNQLGMHQYTNGGKRTLLLDLKSADGRRVFHRLLEDADVVHHNFAGGVLEKLGIGEADIRSRKPDAIISSISAFGAPGYRTGWRGREELGQALTGMQTRYGGPESPRMIFMPLNDFGSGNYSAFATMVALFHRLRTGQAQSVHASLAHTGTFHQIPYMVAFEGREWDEPAGLDAKGWNAYDRLYRAQDRWLYVAAITAEERRAMRAVAGLERVGFEAGGGLDERLAAVLAARPAAEWVERLGAAGVSAQAALTVDEAMEDERAKARGLSLVRKLPDGRRIRTVAPAGRLSVTPAAAGFLVRAPGGDGRAVLEDAGLGEEFRALVDQHVVATELPPGIEMVGRFRAAETAQPGGRADG